jgi:hypothetical protein
MGYKRPTLKLAFEAAEMDGLEVRCRRPSVGAYFDLLDAADKPIGDEANRRVLAEHVMPLIIDWNLEDEDGVPVPATVDGFLAQDTPFIRQITQAVVDVNRQVPGPLAGPSPDGEPFPVDSIPMEIRSPDQQSLPAPS